MVFFFSSSFLFFSFLFFSFLFFFPFFSFFFLFSLSLSNKLSLLGPDVELDEQGMPKLQRKKSYVKKPTLMKFQKRSETFRKEMDGEGGGEEGKVEGVSYR